MYTWTKSKRPQVNRGKTCKHPGCESHARIKGYCRKHYQRRKYLRKSHANKMRQLWKNVCKEKVSG